MIVGQLMLVAMTYNVRPTSLSHTRILIFESPADVPLRRNHRRIFHRTSHVRVGNRFEVSTLVPASRTDQGNADELSCETVWSGRRRDWLVIDWGQRLSVYVVSLGFGSYAFIREFG